LGPEGFLLEPKGDRQNADSVTGKSVEARKKSSETRITDGFNVVFVCSSKEI